MFFHKQHNIIFVALLHQFIIYSFLQTLGMDDFSIKEIGKWQENEGKKMEKQV